MKKNKKHKWKYQINVRKKVLVLIILGVLLFFGLGYAILEANLGMHGTIVVSKQDKTLYSIFLKEYNNGYAERYTGAHQDSMDPSKSTEDIYHFYVTNNDDQAIAVEKNNVLFADMCWELIRTTDTGGVRLLYKGEPEISEENGQTVYNCGATRQRYHIGGGLTTLDLGGNRLYAKNYTATSSNNGNDTIFTLVDDPEDPDDTYTVNLNNSNAEQEIAYIAENYPYTCANTSKTCSNEYFYQVDSYYQYAWAYVSKSTHRKAIGRSKYNDSNSPAYVGYMYGDVYYRENLPMNRWQNILSTGWQSILEQSGINNNFLFAHSVDWNTVEPNRYTLENPYTVSSPSDYQNLVGEYTFRNNNANQHETWIAQIVAVDNTTMYYKVLWNGNTIANYEPYILGDSLIDNGNGTYTLDNEVYLTHGDWYRDYANYNGYYVCGNGGLTCNDPRYIYETNREYYRFIYDCHTGKITLAKGKNGLVLDDYVTIDRIQWIHGYNTTYKDYVYTCGNTDTTCTAANLKYIQQKQDYRFYYSINRYFGTSVIYEDNKYKLQNVIPFEDARNLEKLSTHHYTCINEGETECSQAAYIVVYDSLDNAGYATLQGGNILNPQDLFDAMFTKNTTDSEIKKMIDKWYESKFQNTLYEDKIDDTIYCNNRSFSTATNHTFDRTAWNPNGGYTNVYETYFREYDITKDLSCENTTDKFSVSNNAAKLTYPIALITAPELNLLYSTNWRTIIYDDGRDKLEFYTLSPALLGNGEPHVRMIEGSVSGITYFDYYRTLASVDYVRPAISLIKGTKYSSGDGSTTDPYIVDMSE